MPLRTIQEYIRASAEEDYEECYSVLDRHKTLIEEQLTELTAALELMKYKLKNFRELMTAGSSRKWNRGGTKCENWDEYGAEKRDE